MFRSFNRSKITLLMFMVFFVTSGCAEKKPEFVYYAWPWPPAEPKIAYIASYTGERDFQQFGFLDILMGVSLKQVMSRPFGVAVSGGIIYVADSERGNVLAIDPVNKKVTNIGENDGTSPFLSQPMGIALAKDGTLYVADAVRNDVYMYDQNGTFQKSIGAKIGGFQRPTAVAVDNEAQRLYVVDTKAHQIKVFSLSGEALFVIGQRGLGDNDFNFPTGITVDKKNGNLYIVDSQNHRVKVLDRNGKFVRKFGKAGDEMGAFGLPKSIALDSEGRVYVIDTFNYGFQVLSGEGEPIMRLGIPGSGPGQFQSPAAIFIDENDRIYITDAQNSRVQIFQYMNAKWTSEHPEEYKQYMAHWNAEKKQMEAKRKAPPQDDKKKQQ